MHHGIRCNLFSTPSRGSVYVHLVLSYSVYVLRYFLDHCRQRFVVLPPGRTQGVPRDEQTTDLGSRPVGMRSTAMRPAARRFSTKAASVGGRPGVTRQDEMADAAQKVSSGKSRWQTFMSGVVDTVRPVCSALAPTVMPLLDGPSKRRCAPHAH